jgi:hypothetical protein
LPVVAPTTRAAFTLIRKTDLAGIEAWATIFCIDLDLSEPPDALAGSFALKAFHAVQRVLST